MLKIENYRIAGWEHAIMGMRNAKNSWLDLDGFEKENNDGKV